MQTSFQEIEAEKSNLANQTCNIEQADDQIIFKGDLEKVCKHGLKII